MLKSFELVRNDKNIIILLSFSFLILILCSSNISGATLVNPNATLETNASACLKDSQKIMDQMALEGFKVNRINDTLKQANLTFAAQLSLKAKNRNYDFSSIISSCDEIKSLYDSATAARDEIDSLLKFYNDSVVPGMNTSTIDSILNEINSEMNDERYEKVKPLTDKAYSEIINVKSSYTALNVFYQSTAKGFKAFLFAKNPLFQIANWAVSLILIIILTFIYFVYRIKIHEMIINRKMEKLTIRRKTIKTLIMQTQKDYFQYGKISEGDYNIKVKKFAELIRDIDRQVPLLQEQLAKLNRKIKK